MNYVLNYILIGFVFIFIVDMSTEYIRKRGVTKPPATDEWNWGSRLFTVLIWPVGLFFFLKGYIRQRYFNNKNK